MLSMNTFTRTIKNIAIGFKYRAFKQKRFKIRFKRTISNTLMFTCTCTVNHETHIIIIIIHVHTCKGVKAMAVGFNIAF